MTLPARVTILGTEESLQVLFGDINFKDQSLWVWGEVTACKVKGWKDLSAAEIPERMDMLVICIISFFFYIQKNLASSTTCMIY